MTDNPLTLEWDEDDPPGMDASWPGHVQGRVSTSGALELYEHVEKVLGEWAREGIAARNAVKAGVPLEAFIGAPSNDDPFVGMPEPGGLPAPSGALDDAMRDYGDTQRKRDRENGGET